MIDCKTADRPSTVCVKYQVCSDANMLLLQLNVCPRWLLSLRRVFKLVAQLCRVKYYLIFWSDGQLTCLSADSSAVLTSWSLNEIFWKLHVSSCAADMLWVFNRKTAAGWSPNTRCSFRPAARTRGPTRQVFHIILMGVLHQHINSHYCSSEPPGIYYDKFLSAPGSQHGLE